MLFRYFLLWFPITIVAIVNGAARNLFYTKQLGELRAHQLSTVSGLILFTLYFWVITAKWRIESSSQAIMIGLMWLAMTLIFEFGFGHFIARQPWEKLLHDYNLLQGRLWVLILIWVTAAPYVFFRINN